MRRLGSPSRWISIGGLVIGVFFLFFQFFVEHRSLFRAVLEAATASFAAMVVGGVAHRFWSGARVAEATAGPGGAAVKFERPVRSLVEELHGRLEKINERLVAVEDAVDALTSSQRPGDG